MSDRYVYSSDGLWCDLTKPFTADHPDFDPEYLDGDGPWFEEVEVGETLNDQDFTITEQAARIATLEAQVEGLRGALEAIESQLMNAQPHLAQIPNAWADVHIDMALLKCEAALSAPAPTTDLTRLRAIEKAARELSDQLHTVHGNDRYGSVWLLAQLHNGPYDGPTYTEQLANLDAALDAKEGPDGHV